MHFFSWLFHCYLHSRHWFQLQSGRVQQNVLAVDLHGFENMGGDCFVVEEESESLFGVVGSLVLDLVFGPNLRAVKLIIAVMANWENINHEILVEIAKRMRRSEDYVAFRGNFMFCPIPLLMLAPRKDSYVHDFYDPSKGTTQHVILPETSGKRCFSSKGCLVLIGQEDLSNLYNPFSCQHFSQLSCLRKIGLACQFSEEGFCFQDNPTYAGNITKCVLSSSPLLASDYIMMAIHGERELSYDETWTATNSWCGRYQDVTYYKGQFYAVNTRGRVMACIIRGDNPSEAEQVAKLLSSPNRYDYLLYIVVCRSIDFTYITLGFKVFKVDLSDNTWSNIKDLGDRVPFLGFNSSFSCAAHLSNSKPNSIYFTHDSDELYSAEGGGKDMGIYSLLDGSITPHFSGDSLHPINPPIWVEPSFI
ncbi:hypothetical protein ACOSP7_016614 [Xanthoceras sorbifolium]